MIYLIRHGQTEWNRDRIFRGHKDLPLSKEGKIQAAKTARWLRERDISVVYSSPLVRAFETASVIAAECRCPVVKEEGIIDLDFGDWEGNTFDRVKKNDPEQYRLYRYEPERCTIPGGESLKGCYERAFRCFLHIAAKHVEDGSQWAMVSHRVILKLLLIGILGLSLSAFWKIALDTCSICGVEPRGGGFIIRGINSRCHLTDSFEYGIDF
jgi:broad specificity phosphatase PhoE